MAMNFDPMTGEPINPAPTPAQEPVQQMNFDPMTGKPINPAPAQEPVQQMNFDSMTVQQINPAPAPTPAPEPVQQMNFDPMTGQPINPTPVQPQPQMAFDPMTGMPLQQPPKKKKKTGLIVGIVAAAVVVAGAGTVFAGIQSGFFLSKSNKVLMATANTFSEPSHFTEALSGLSVMSSKAYTVDIKGEAEGYSGYSVQATYAEKDNEKQISGSVEGPELSDVEFLAGIDKDEIKLSAPLLGDKIYTYNYNEKKSGYLVDSMGADNVETLDKLCKQMFSDEEQKKNALEFSKKYSEMYKKLEFESTDKESFEVDGKDRKCAGYKTTITSDYMIECVDIFEDYMDAQMGDLLDQAVKGSDYDDYKESFDQLRDAFKEMPDIDITFYIYKNKLACIKAVEPSKEDQDIQILFKGGDRRTQNMELISCGESVMKISGSEDGNEEVFGVSVEGEKVGELTYDFKSGEYTLDIEDEGSVSGTLEGKRDGLTLTMEGDGVNISLDVKKGAELQKFSGEKFDIGNASEEDLQTLVQEIYGISGGNSGYGDGYNYDDGDYNYDDGDYNYDYGDDNSDDDYNYDDYNYDDYNYDEGDEL